MKKQIPELEVNYMKKGGLNILNEIILNQSDYFQKYDINSLTNRQSNLLHIALSYKKPQWINRLLEENIDIFKQNQHGMYPVFYCKSMKEFNLLISHPKIKSNPGNVEKLKSLLFNDMVSPVYYWKPTEFKEFLVENKEMFNSLNDDCLTFLLNINQLLSVNLHEVWNEFRKENNIEISKNELYLYIIDKVKDNKNNHYRAQSYSEKENEKINILKDYKLELLKTLHSGLENHEEFKKSKKIKPFSDKYFYLLQTSEYEQVEFLFNEIEKIKETLKKGKINYLESNDYLAQLWFQWKDYLNKERIPENELKIICEENGLYGINLSPIFSLTFIKNLIEDLKKETFKVFPIKDKKLFAQDAYLKISNSLGQHSGYLNSAKGKNILNVDISDYSLGRDKIFPDEMKDLKSCFVHEYTHYLQLVSEYHFELDFNTNSQWLKVEDKILRNTNKENLITKLKAVMLEEFERNGFEFKESKKLDNYFIEAFAMTDIKEAKKISQKIISISPEFTQTTDHKNYMLNNVEFIYKCLNSQENNLQELYLDKLNKDEYLKNYYDDPLEIHARLNENIVNTGKDLLREFNFLSVEDNQLQKKAVLKDLKKFNLLMLNHFENLKEKKIGHGNNNRNASSLKR